MPLRMICHRLFLRRPLAGLPQQLRWRGFLLLRQLLRPRPEGLPDPALLREAQSVDSPRLFLLHRLRGLTYACLPSLPHPGTAAPQTVLVARLQVRLLKNPAAPA